MVRLRLAGGGLSPSAFQERLKEAAQHYADRAFQAAADIYRDILREEPREVESLHMLGIIAQQAGNNILALKFIEAALKLKPSLARAWFNRALVLRVIGQDAAALQSLQCALEIEDELAEAWDLRGQIEKDDGNYISSKVSFERAIRLQPQNASFHSNYALLLLALKENAAAFCALRIAELLDPNHPPLMLGNIYKSMGFPEQAALRYARTSALRPDFREAAASEAMSYLQMGDFARGWKLWEQRPDLETSVAQVPLWQGAPVDRLLVYEDQGLGDALQFGRYLPLVARKANQIIMRIRDPLRALFENNFPNISFVAETEVLPTIDARCRLSSLPHLFRTDLNSIPSETYLVASVVKRTHWRRELNSVESPSVGLAWAGNTQFHNDMARSLGLPDLEPVIQCGPAHFVSLQKERKESSDAVAQAGLFDPCSGLNDFSDTAALIAELDLVITVDTAVAHLAGTLGRPVFILLPFDADWRWLLGRDDSPWYPTARLYRQKKTGDWREVLLRVSQDVTKYIAGDKSILAPKIFTGQSLRQNPDALALPL